MIAVSGAAGYIGTRLLQRNDWRGFDRRPAPGVEEADFSDRATVAWALEGADVLVHLAAVPGVEDCEEDPTAALRHNAVAAGVAADVCREKDVRLVFPSSDAVNGRTFYGATKAAAERLVLGMPGLDSVVLRLSNAYGRYEAGGSVRKKGNVVEAFVDAAREGGVLPVHAPGTQRRNFVHVDDVCSAVESATERGEGVVPVCGPDTMSIRALAGVVAEEGGAGWDVVGTDRPGTETEPTDDRATAERELRYTPERDVRGYVEAALGAEA